MRKILPLLLCLALLLTATACFRSKVDPTLPQGTASSKQSTTASTTTTTASSTSATSGSATDSTTSGTGTTTSATDGGSTTASTTTTTTVPPVIGENPSTFPWIGTVTAVDGVNVRSAPDSSDYGNVIASGMYGDRVQVIGQEGQWYKVLWEFGSDDVQEAYVSAQFVQYFSEVNP